ncbi:fasciclin domain-containing protein [Pseudoflavitalea sp. G-6-1-2]|uniref:fasciclin domain-containing protein n=1 Tax=Pseudoflavitalea sp. G-6-1-2 TaxID=2728841 RepID=UPI00146B5967|nr:fasciclin domain-containing protein [Pseudoflavitalea sp. G-6-1-2]NML22615.1 fasciclin domain-containing protein [Pseudoflavitalea sp. G-6-1-2]
MMMHHRHTTITRFSVLAVLLLAAVAFNGCSKEDDLPVPEKIDRTRIGYLIEDNFSLSTLYNILHYTKYDAELRSGKSYTMLAPTNEAFNLVGIVASGNFQSDDPWFPTVMRSSILTGAHLVGGMPLGENQPLPSASGFSAYISRIKVGEDIVTTVNGARLQNTDVKAGNGYMQVTSEVVQPELTKNIWHFFLNDTTYTLFSLALQHAGIMPALKTGDYTILAIPNEILRKAENIKPGINLSSADMVLASDPVELAGLLKYHILGTKCFMDRLYRQAKASGDATITTLNGAKITVSGNENIYNDISLKGTGNSIAARIYRPSYASPNYANIPAGNGVIHGINQVLIP